MAPASSLNSLKNSLPQNDEKFYVYSSLATGSDGNSLFMRDSTAVTPLMVMLFGGNLRTDGRGNMKMDDWLPLRINSSVDVRWTIQLILEFKKALDRMLQLAFNSLSEGQNSSLIANDAIRQEFVGGVVRVLEHNSRGGGGFTTGDRGRDTRSNAAY